MISLVKNQIYSDFDLILVCCSPEPSRRVGPYMSLCKSKICTICTTHATVAHLFNDGMMLDRFLQFLLRIWRTSCNVPYPIATNKDCEQYNLIRKTLSPRRKCHHIFEVFTLQHFLFALLR
jgi:hypothetical protein